SLRLFNCDARRIEDRSASVAPPVSPIWGGGTGQRRAFMNRIINVTLAGVAAVGMAVSLGAGVPAFAQMKDKEKTVTVGGAPMFPSKNIVQNAVNSKDHTTLV